MNPQKLISFDIGGVLADVEKKDIDESYFHGRYFRDFSLGRLSSADYFQSVARITKAKASEIEHSFRGMIQRRAYLRTIIHSLNVPFTFWSNINASHFGKFLQDEPLLNRHLIPRGLSFEIGHLKPSPLFFKSNLETLGLSPKNIVFIDDRSQNVLEAKKLGISSFQASNEKEISQILASLGLLKS